MLSANESTEFIKLNKKKVDTGFLIKTKNQAIVDNRYLYDLNSSELRCEGTPGETRSLSVTLKALENLKNIKVNVTDLLGNNGVINSSAIDIRYVKWWYQARSNDSVGIRYTKGRVYKAELLLKDNDLVKVDRITRNNYVRSTDEEGNIDYLLASGPSSENLIHLRPQDSKYLKYINLKKNDMQEYWINIHIPKTSKPGIYYGKLIFSSDNLFSKEVPIKITVYPFQLEKSPLIYALYYTSRIHKTGKISTGAKWTYWKSKEQYKNEILNMKEHGVLYPLNYQKNNKEMKEILEIRKNANLPTDLFFNHDGYTGNPIKQKDLEKLEKKVKGWINLLKSYGYKTIYFYGIDEAKGELFVSQKKAWELVHTLGGKNFVATKGSDTESSIKTVGSLLDAAVLHGKTNFLYSKAWHKIGSKVFSYANPQVGEEKPTIYRYNFGLKLWKDGYDGAMDFAYHYAFNHGWNDFDHPKYRDHMFVYPTTNGVIDTIAWEGFREGVYDVRYIATLQKFIKNTKDLKLAYEAQLWLDNLRVSKENLDGIRTEIVQWILKLQSTKK